MVRSPTGALSLPGTKQRNRKGSKMKRILDPSFRYKPSFATDLRKTFERVRRELQAGARDVAAMGADMRENVLRMSRSRKGG